MSSRVDASMDMLREIREQALEPGYKASGPSMPKRPVALIATMLAIGLLIGIAFGTTLRAAPAGAVERVQLVDRIRQLESEHDALRARLLDLDRENTELVKRKGATDPASEELTRQLGAQAGAVAVRGPGVRYTVDDGPETSQGISRVLDADIRALVNGLWASGAEAITVNGRRLSARTSIREAGDAVTVDYRSLTRPYVIEAIGNQTALTEGFSATAGGAWWRSLVEQYAMRLTVENANSLSADADPGLVVDRARAVR